MAANMSLARLLKEARITSGLRQKDVFDRLGIKENTVSNYENGVSRPDIETFMNLCELYKADYKLILQKSCGYDVPHSQTVSSFDIKKEAPSELPEEALKVAKDYTKLDERGRGAVKAILTYEGGAVVTREPEPKPQKVTPLPKAKRTRGGMVEIKVYDQPAAAGLGNYLDEPAHHLEQYPDGVAHPDTDFGVIISGDSMEPKIHDGGTVFVQSTPSIDPGKIGIFILNGQAYCKKLAVDHENRQVRLVSLNPDYEDIIIQDGDEMRTLGRVLGQWTKGYPNDDIFGW